jgi:Fe-S-cluster-containing hydrogenase component 2
MCCPVDAIRVWAGVCRVLETCIDCDLCARYCPADAITSALTSQALAAGSVVV